MIRFASGQVLIGDLEAINVKTRRIKEYWIVDPKAKTVEIYTPQESGFENTGRYNIEDQIISALFRNLDVRIEEFFRED